MPRVYTKRQFVVVWAYLKVGGTGHGASSSLLCLVLNNFSKQRYIVIVIRLKINYNLNNTASSKYKRSKKHQQNILTDLVKPHLIQSLDSGILTITPSFGHDLAVHTK